MIRQALRIGLVAVTVSILLGAAAPAHAAVLCCCRGTDCQWWTIPDGVSCGDELGSGYGPGGFGTLVCGGSPRDPRTPPQPPITFTPQVPLPGFAGGAVTGTTFGEYIRAFYVFFIGAVGILAVVMMMFGGFQWLTAAGNQSRISNAQTTINGATIGLILALTSYLLLRLINPSLVRFTDLSVLYIEPIEQPQLESGHNPSTCQKQDGMKRIFGDPENQVEPQLEVVPYRNTAGGSYDTYRFHRLVAQRVRAVFEEIRDVKDSNGVVYNIARDPDETYAKRKSTFNQQCWSFHAFGLAIDINPTENPACQEGTYCYTFPKSDIPNEIIRAFNRQGFVWGGTWASVHDYMHFELSPAVIQDMLEAQGG